MPDTRAHIIPGLCATCKQMSRVETPRGSVFVMCNLSKTDLSFPKYPRLPVLQCRGYELDTKKHQNTQNA